MGKLYLIPTPIGNMKDITPRILETLRNVDYIYCEDTRNTRKIMSYFDIHKVLKSYHMFNEDKKCNEIIGELKEGMDIALVSDAGYPGISDPGYLICNKAIEAGLPVTTLPGASASITALVGSGINLDKFYFYGFLNHDLTQKKKELDNLKDYPYTIIFYESPHRIKETLEVLNETFGNRYMVIAKDLTKKYEEYIRGNISDILSLNRELKGEMVLVVSGKKANS